MKENCDQLRTKTLDQSNKEIMMDIKRSVEGNKQLKVSLESMKRSHEDMTMESKMLKKSNTDMTIEIKKLKKSHEDTVPWNIRGKTKVTVVMLITYHLIGKP